jgi:hypothetical protein
MDLHKPKTFKALSKMGLNPMGSKVIHDELAQTLNPIPASPPSLPLPPKWVLKPIGRKAHSFMKQNDGIA